MNINEETKQQKNYLSDVLIYDSFKLGMFNLITAPCGSGKTVAAFTTIPNYLKVEPKRSLIIVNTRAAADAFVNEDYCYYFNFHGKEWDEEFLQPTDKPTVMTYANFGAQIKKGNLHIENYDYIVCDEIHCLNQYISINRNKLRKTYPQALPWEINDMLQITCLNYIALENLIDTIQQGRVWIFGLTATPSQLYKNDLKQLGNIVNEVQFSQKLHAYEIFCKFEYAEIEPILRAIVPENRKRLFFFNTIRELKQYKQILLECGRAAEAIWSDSAKETMSQHQMTTRDFVLNDHRMPDDVQDLLINDAYGTSINIKDALVQEVYIHTGNIDTQTQVRNRMRQNLEIVGIYNHAKNKSTNKEIKMQILEDECIKKIPPCFLNISLFNEDKEHLINIIDFPKKWPSLKKALQRANYIVLDKNNGKARYSIIQEPN